MNQKFLTFVSILVLSLLVIGLLFGSVSQLPLITTVDADSNQAVNDHISVNRIPQIASKQLEVGTEFVIVILIDNIVDTIVSDVMINQTIPEETDKNTLNITNVNPGTFNDTWASHTFDFILPGERETFNVTVMGIGNKTFSSIALPSLNVTYDYGEYRLPAWKNSDIRPTGDPSILTFEITNASAEPILIDDFGGATFDINFLSPIIFILVPVVIAIGMSFFWSKKNRRNKMKRI
ncbi:MAG: hypothetical protein HeimC3_00880 [Candidatus Heimdallarchaeota archaeon LC_3]|nr:MAG: hypothetical protein HeimC3_00880 [Candidatus Heimdallarchaeota archaeon LC_3]